MKHRWVVCGGAATGARGLQHKLQMVKTLLSVRCRCCQVPSRFDRLIDPPLLLCTTAHRTVSPLYSLGLYEKDESMASRRACTYMLLGISLLRLPQLMGPVKTHHSNAKPDITHPLTYKTVANQLPRQFQRRFHPTWHLRDRLT